MSGAGRTWVGADPGGKGAFGVAVLNDRGIVATATCDCAAQAMDIVRRHTSAANGAGVDAPLWWSAGPSADRHADQWLRKRYGLSGGQVQASNSLRSAALVQGALFCQLLRQQYPAIGLTEAHPKVMLGVAGGDWSQFADRYEVSVTPASQHLQDALVAAVCAREGFSGRWHRDLSKYRGIDEQDPEAHWLGPVHYFWPED